MSKTFCKYILCCLATFSGSLALADIRMEPGLWELTKEVQSTTGAMEKELKDLAEVPKMPAVQREAMMATLAQQGVRFGADGSPRFMSCVSEETAKQFPLANKNQRGCKSIVKQDNDTVMEVVTTCSDAASTAEMDVIFHSKRNFTMTALSTQKNADGTTERISIKSTGTWVGSSCAGVATAQ